MCGICGIFKTRGCDEHDVESIQRMAKALIHRGPNDRGEFRSPNLVMDMQRLSIIDVAGGQQPLTNEAGSIVLIANGEVYNYVELRERLIGLGHVFSTRSDCETIIHSYEQYGLEFVSHLRGMFAIALYDKTSKRLVLVRDRMGEKPLYLWEGSGALAFASEMKGLLASGLVPFEYDPAAIGQYFRFQYVPEPRTVIRNVRKLGAGCMLVVNLNSGERKEHRYWRMEESPALDGDPASVLRELLEEAGRLTIRSDVPVGVALSGGLDSSVVAALATKFYSGKLRAFTVGYEGQHDCDERKAAGEFAGHLGIPWFETEISIRDVVQSFPLLNIMRDDPIADISGYGYYRVMQMARENNVPVMLQGQGGDELFWGYPWVVESVVATERKQQLLKKNLCALFRYFKMSGPEKMTPWFIRDWLENLGGARQGMKDLCRDLRLGNNAAVFYELAPDFLQASSEVRRYCSADIASESERTIPGILALDDSCNIQVQLTRLVCETYLRGNGIVQADRLSMAASVESRLPLLDYRFVEAVIGLRKARPNEGLIPPKRWLIDAIDGLVPAWVVDRPKRGFTPPLRLWYAAIKDAHGSCLQDGLLIKKGILKKAEVGDLIKGTDLAGGVAPFSFKALVLEMWCRGMQDIAENS